MAARGDVLVGLLDELRAGEDIRLHETRRLLNGLSSKDSFVHSCCVWLHCFNNEFDLFLETTKIINKLTEKVSANFSDYLYFLIRCKNEQTYGFVTLSY